MKRETIDAILAARRERRSLVLLSRLDGGGQELLSPQDATVGHPQAEAIAACLESGRSRVLEAPDGEVFLQALLPQPRLLVVGATHIAQVLVRLAREMAFDVCIVDPRTAFATEDRFPGAELVTEWPEEALGAIGLDRRTAVVTLGHEADIDDEALLAALAGNCFYVGALGSRRTHAKRLDRLAEKGLTAAETDRIHAPVGLDIGASGPAEIALSIMAEVVASLRRPGSK